MKMAADTVTDQNLSSKTILITGASSGLGAETARALAQTDANLVITARNIKAGESVLEELRELGTGRHALFALDLADPADVTRFAGQVATDYPAIDVLIANAGCAQTPQDRLDNGFDVRFATNYLGHFLLAHALLDPLSAQGARIVLLGSAGHKGKPVSLDDPAWLHRDIDQRLAYGESKSALSLFAVEATRRWHGRNIFANCVLPGSVITGLQRHHTAERMAEMKRIGGVDGPESVFTTADKGAETTVWAAVAPELDRVGALVLESCGPCRISGPRHACLSRLRTPRDRQRARPATVGSYARYGRFARYSVRHGQAVTGVSLTRAAPD